MACGTCPDAVTYTLRNKVQESLDQVRAIKELSNVFSRALQDIAGLADADVAAAVDAIPTVPGINFVDILGYLTCPLTPLAIALDPSAFSDLDPTVQLQRLKGLFKAEIDNARQSYEDALQASSYHQVIDLARKYANEFIRIRFDAVTFAEAILISATVFAVCGQEEYEEGPYLDFANEVTNFSLTGGLPSGMSTNVAALTQKLLQAEAKFKALQAALVAV